VVTTSLVLCLLFPAEVPERKLTGTWVPEMVELDGGDVTRSIFQNALFPTKVRFRGDSSVVLIWKNGREVTGTYKVELKTNRILAISFKDSITVKGIFILDGDYLLFCCNELPASTVPTRFSSKNNGIIYLLKRTGDE